MSRALGIVLFPSLVSCFDIKLRSGIHIYIVVDYDTDTFKFYE